MLRRLPISIAVLALSIILSPILTIGQQGAEPPKNAPSTPPAARIGNQGQSSKNKGVAPNAVGNSPARVAIEGTVSVAGELKTQATEKQPSWHTNPDWWLVITAAGALLFAALAWHASRDQANIAREQLIAATSPRLHIERVWAVDFSKENTPTFFVKISNAGPAPAEGVAITIRVESRLGGVKYSSGEQRIAIPANGNRDIFIEWPKQLTESEFDIFWSGHAPLTVSGYFQERDKERVRYCYKYKKWHLEKSGIPQFIPCDFDEKLTVLIPPQEASTAPFEGRLETKHIHKEPT